MKKLFGLVSLFLLVGCAKTITVTPPNLSSKFDLDIPFAAPATPKIVKLIPKDGIKAVTQDNVTVKIDSVVPASSESDYIVTVEDPNIPDKRYQFELFPMLLKLKIANNSNHIITLTKTIVKLEDEKQNDYPMMNTMAENKQRLIAQIQHAYQPFTSGLQGIGVEKCKGNTFELASNNYRELVREVNRIRKEGNNVRTPDMPHGYYLNEIGINDLFDKYSPENAAKRICENEYIYKQITEISQKAGKQMQDALYKISQIPDNMKNAITNGVYQPINILPGRSEIIVVPFGPKKEGEEIRFMHVAIFDLPTRVDDAGNPTKRAHFYFDLVAAN